MNLRLHPGRLYVCRHLLDTEAKLAPRFGCLDGHGASEQPMHAIDGRFRGLVVAWLLELSSHLRCRSATAFLTISLLDRFLSRTKARPRLPCGHPC